MELSIIWTSPGPDGTVDMLEQIIRRIEWAMGIPFPRQQVIYKIEPDGEWFGYFGGPYVHVSGHRSPWQLKKTVSHEAAHYYWTWPIWNPVEMNPAWVSEGAAEFLALLDENVALGAEPGSECDLNITEAERLPRDGPRCWYDIGHEFYRDLYSTMDEVNFRLAFRRWYLHTRHVVPTCRGDETTYCRVMESFTTYASEGNRAAVEELINRWYGATQ